MTTGVSRWIHVDGSPRQVWQALTDPEHLRGWFCDEAEVDFSPGAGTYRCTGRHVPCGARPERLLEWEPGRLVRFHWTPSGDETVTFRLTPSEGFTRLEVTHVCQRNDCATEDWRLMTDCLWAYFTLLLKQWVETGSTGYRLTFDPDPPSVIRFRITCPVPADEAFAALTRPDRLDCWISSGAQVEPRVGGKYSLGWGTAGEDGPGRITAWTEGRLLAYTWFESGRQTEVVWRISPHDGGCTVELEHGDFGGYTAACLGCRLGWADWMNVLWLHLRGRPAARTWRGALPFEHSRTTALS